MVLDMPLIPYERLFVAFISEKHLTSCIENGGVFSGYTGIARIIGKVECFSVLFAPPKDNHPVLIPQNKALVIDYLPCFIVIGCQVYFGVGAAFFAWRSNTC